jgi:uncharacterized membrane protein
MIGMRVICCCLEMVCVHQNSDLKSRDCINRGPNFGTAPTVTVSIAATTILALVSVVVVRVVVVVVVRVVVVVMAAMVSALLVFLMLVVVFQLLLTLGLLRNSPALC